MSKRPGGSLGSLMSKKANTDKKAAANNPTAGRGPARNRNPFLSQPIQPEKSLATFLMQCRQSARGYLPKETTKFPITTPFCEIEARIGVLKVNDRRVASSGPKRIQNTIVQAFDCSSLPNKPSMASGVTRSHFVHWTQSGLSEPGPLTAALGVVATGKTKEELARAIKTDLVETELVETVFAGYPGERRITVPGLVPMPTTAEPQLPTPGSMEYKEKLRTLDWTLPAAKYDMRVSLASEKIVDQRVVTLPRGWSIHRVKRRRSYSRRDKNLAWQIDVTQVTTTPAATSAMAGGAKTVTYEVEMEIMPQAMLSLINKATDDQALPYAKSLAQQLWWILGQINPLSDVVDVEEYLQDHPSRKDVQLALATCGALKKFMEGRPTGDQPLPFPGPIATPDETPSAALTNLKFPGCMPVNFSRHNMEDIQQDSSNGYYVSEKTDGVRHFMIFTGSSVVLVDRAMRGKRAVPLGSNKDAEPMAHVLPLIQPGTVLDGEVVLHRGSSKHKARPVFIVFDVMAISGNKAILHMPFEKRLDHLKKATFRSKTANRNMFDDKCVADMSLPLPLVRKNFVRRTDLVDLLSHVVEEKGLRSYRNGVVHNHLTDGIIFQPNTPYVCGTDVNLLKWKYLDTVTIDVEILPPRINHRGNDGDEDELRVGVLGEDQTKVDMTRYVQLPTSERLRLEADRAHEGPNANIAEVGFDPETGEWYYLTMRPDKVAPNHISTVLGTLLELSESLTASELQYRLSLPPGARDTYRKDVRGMMSQLLQHQQKKQKSSQHHRK